jgi:hypothetical protein
MASRIGRSFETFGSVKTATVHVGKVKADNRVG